MTLDRIEFATGLPRVEAVPAHDDVVVPVFAAPIGIGLSRQRSPEKVLGAFSPSDFPRLQEFV